MAHFFLRSMFLLAFFSNLVWRIAVLFEVEAWLSAAGRRFFLWDFAFSMEFSS
jgi:hypothetical protein